MKILYNLGAIAGADESGRLKKSGAEMSDFQVIPDAWIAIDDDRIAAYGSMPADRALLARADEAIDMKGQWLFPSFCDSHTHIVYAGNRAGEFLDKIRGLSYEEIGRRGGGILNSADLLHATPEDDLFSQSMVRVNEMIAKGTGAIEIKSGYGLTTADELKMLRVIRRIRESSAAEIRATFLGAHAVGRAFAGRQADYVDLVCREMIPEVGRQGLADFVDVFCDEGYFTCEETERMLDAAAKWGLRPKIHANELAVSGGVQVGVKCGALSVDHLERTTPVEFEALKRSDTMPTILPGTSFFLGIPFADGKEMIRRGLPIALASDYNPGSSPSGDMRFVASLGSIRMRLEPQQSLVATTLNSAYAMGVSREMGSVSVGKLASFFLTEPLPSLEYLLYAYTQPLISGIWLRGRQWR